MQKIPLHYTNSEVVHRHANHKHSKDAQGNWLFGAVTVNHCHNIALFISTEIFPINLTNKVWYTKESETDDSQCF